MEEFQLDILFIDLWALICWQPLIAADKLIETCGRMFVPGGRQIRKCHSPIFPFLFLVAVRERLVDLEFGPPTRKELKKRLLLVDNYFPCLKIRDVQYCTLYEINRL